MTSYMFEMDPKCEISLYDIHHLVESSLSGIKQKHEQIDGRMKDVKYLTRVIENVIKPINRKLQLDKVENINHLKTLLNACSRGSSPMSPITYSKGNQSIATDLHKELQKLATRPTSEINDGREKSRISSCVSLPPLNCNRVLSSQRKYRNETAQGNNSHLALDSLSNSARRVPRSPTAIESTKSLQRTDRIIRQRNRARITNAQPLDSTPSIRQIEMAKFLDDVEREIRLLQETFSMFTQRVLVPLQTFCKYQPQAIPMKKVNHTNTEENNNKDDLPKKDEPVDRIEFRIVEMMNNIRQVLWSSENSSMSKYNFAEQSTMQKTHTQTDYLQFPLVFLVLNVVEKFSEVLRLATTWLKRDILYIQNMKAILNRVHRRYLKTERLWHQARESQRHLRGEWDSVLSDLQTHTIRLHSLDDDIKQLHEELDKTRSSKKTLEIKLQNTTENLDRLRARHRTFRKRIIILSTKIEARERSHGFLESRVLSLKADQDALAEKLRISEEYADNLQNKMEELYVIRDACSQRYEDKTDSDKLRVRLQQSRLRMPLPSLREKTFILRTRMENLRDALTLIEQRLSSNGLHWSTLCENLSWPFHNKSDELQGENQEDNDIRLSSSFSDGSEGSTGLTSDLQRHDNCISANNESTRIKRQVLSTFPNDERRQRSFMLKLWLDNNGSEASIEKLLAALRISNGHPLADSIERCIT